MKIRESLFSRKTLDQIKEKGNTKMQIIQYLRGDFAKIL